MSDCSLPESGARSKALMGRPLPCCQMSNPCNAESNESRNDEQCEEYLTKFKQCFHNLLDYFLLCCLITNSITSSADNGKLTVKHFVIFTLSSVTINLCGAVLLLTSYLFSLPALVSGYELCESLIVPNGDTSSARP